MRIPFRGRDRVVPHGVRPHEREPAVRIALGASRPRVFGLLLFDVKLVMPGVAGGILLSFALDSDVPVESTRRGGTKDPSFSLIRTVL
jgi:hypothetical protein